MSEKNKFTLDEIKAISASMDKEILNDNNVVLTSVELMEAIKAGTIKDYGKNQDENEKSHQENEMDER